MTRTEIVWRHLLHASQNRIRRFESVNALSNELGIDVSTVHAALQRPATIGAVNITASGELRVIDPYRLAVLWASRRRLDKDTVATWQTTTTPFRIEHDVVAQSLGVVGGHGAVVHHLGHNRIADYQTALIYTDNVAALTALAPADDDGDTTVIVARPDPLIEQYGPYTTLHQAWVDLFCQPNWMAARFTDALTRRWVDTD